MRPPLSTQRVSLFVIFLSLTTHDRRVFGLSVATLRKDTKISAFGKVTAPVTPPPQDQNHDEDVTLASYMRLPVEQYVLIPMPLGSTLSRRPKTIDGGNKECAVQTESPSSSGEEFELVVPTINFFGLKVQPVVSATVRPEKDRVLISSHRCTLRGSPLIEKIELNNRFDFRIETTLTWEDSRSLKSAPRGADDDDCSISAETHIDVDVSVPKPFSSIPKRVSVSTGNAALRISLSYIQSNFVDNLVKDYKKWATDENYRSFRASLSEGSNIDESLVGSARL